MSAARVGCLLALLPATATGVARAEAGDPQHLHSSVELMAGPAVLARSFEFRGEQFGTLPAYELRAAPAVRALLRVSASAVAPNSRLEPLQLYAGVAQGLSITSRVGDVETDTGANAWGLGLRIRIPVDSHEIAGEVGYGQHSFFFVDDAPRNADGYPALPSVGYGFVRSGIEARAELDRAIIGLRLGHRIVTDAGDIGTDEWFPRLHVQGFDAGVVVGWGFSERLGVLAGAETCRYWYALRPEPASQASLRSQAATGAVDLHTTWWLGLTWWVDSPTEPADEEEL